VTKTIGRVYAAAISVVVFFVAWAVIAAKPWVTTSSASAASAGLPQLQAKEIQMQARALAVQKILDARWAPYRAALAARRGQLTAQQQLQLAGAPAGPSVSVKVIYLPGAQTTTRTSPLP